MKHFAAMILIIGAYRAMLPATMPPPGGRSCHVDADCRVGETCQQRDGVWQCIETKGSEP